MIKLKIKYGNSQTDLRFPCTEKEMNAALERIHAEDVTPLELYVSEVVFPEELGCLQDRFVNLDEVNYLGKRMDSFFGDEEYQFYEAMKGLRHSARPHQSEFQPQSLSSDSGHQRYGKDR